MSTTLLYVVIIAVMLYMSWNSNKKNKQKEKQMMDSLRPGMYIMLKDGLYGTIVDVLQDDMVVNISVDGTDEGCVVVSKSNVSQVVESASGDQAPGSYVSAGGSMEDIVNRAARISSEYEDSEEEGTEDFRETGPEEGAEPDAVTPDAEEQGEEAGEIPAGADGTEEAD